MAPRTRLEDTMPSRLEEAVKAKGSYIKLWNLLSLRSDDLMNYCTGAQVLVSLFPPSPPDYFWISENFFYISKLYYFRAFGGANQREFFGHDWYSKVRLKYGILRYSSLHD